LCTKHASKDSIFCTVLRCSTEYTILAGFLCRQQTTFTLISNPPSPAQADGGQGCRSMCKGSLGPATATLTLLYCMYCSNQLNFCTNCGCRLVAATLSEIILSISLLASLLEGTSEQLVQGSRECSTPYLFIRISNPLQPAQTEVVWDQRSIYLASRATLTLLYYVLYSKNPPPLLRRRWPRARLQLTCTSSDLSPSGCK
jgi:hypothetical protein